LNNDANSDRTKGRQSAFIVFALFAITMIGSCLLAKRLVVGASYSTGMGIPTSKVPGMICSGIAFASPFYSAIILSIVGISQVRKLVFAVLWMATIIVAFVIGNTAFIYYGSPVLFSTNSLLLLPALTHGWLVPIWLVGVFKGWRLEFLDSPGYPLRTRITITNLLALTFVVSLCFFALQFRRTDSHMSWMIGLLVAALLGTIGVLLVWFIMRIRYFVVTYLLIVGATYFSVHLLMVRTGAGPWAVPNAIFLTTFVFALLGGFVLARLNGVQLATGGEGIT
jgi:hypothetical protein